MNKVLSKNVKKGNILTTVFHTKKKKISCVPLQGSCTNLKVKFNAF